MPNDNQALLLQVSADVSRLEKQFSKAQGIVDKGSRNMERRAQQASTNLEKYFGKTDAAKALDKVFDGSRLRIFDSATARIGLTGSALESLGPAGLAAAAGVAALAAAFVGARNAAKFADDIADTANRLHVTTDALQEYRFAIRAAGGDEKGADEALEAFSTTLGLAQAGLKKGQRGFKELGFSEAQIKGFTDADTALKAVVERIAGLSNVQQDAVIKQLGLEGLKPLIAAGADEMTRLRSEAHKLGLVMDAELIKRGGALNDEFETVAKVIDIQLKSALVDLGPVLLDLLKIMAEMAKVAADIADGFKSIQNRRTSRLIEDRDIGNRFGNLPVIGGVFRKQAGANLQELIKRGLDPANQRPSIKPTRSLIDTSKSGGSKSGPRDDTEQRLEQIASILAGALQSRLRAEGQLTEDIEERARIEREIAEQESLAAIARLNKAKADLADDKGFKGDKAAAAAQLDLAITAETKARDAKLDLIARQADWAAEDRADETRQLIRDAEFATLEAAAAGATTQKERTRIEAEILRLKQIELGHENAKQLSRLEQTGAISDAEGAERRGAFERGQAVERGQFAEDHQTPIQQYLSSIQDLNTEMETAGVRAIDSFADGLADAIINAKSLGDVARNVFLSLAQDILSASLKEGIGSLLGTALGSIKGGLPAHAAGSNFTPGGLSLVGERGPELVNLPRGAQVIPNDILRGLSKPGGGGGRTYAPTLHVNVQGAGMTAADARRTGAQVGAAAMREMAKARKAGF